MIIRTAVSTSVSARNAPTAERHAAATTATGWMLTLTNGLTMNGRPAPAAAAATYSAAPGSRGRSVGACMASLSEGREARRGMTAALKYASIGQPDRRQHAVSDR